MKGCPVTFHLALIIVALLANDVESNVHLLAVDEAQAAAMRSDSSAPLAAIRLLDSEGTTLAGACGSQTNRDWAAKAFAELHYEVRGSLATGIAAKYWQAPSASSTLAVQHIRLQI
jgi:hypothetical protein